MNSLETLPVDVQKIVFEYAFKCKKEQNFYIMLGNGLINTAVLF